MTKGYVDKGETHIANLSVNEQEEHSGGICVKYPGSRTHLAARIENTSRLFKLD